MELINKIKANQISGTNVFPFLWIHGDEAPGVIENRLSKMLASGIFEFCIEARPHKDFLQAKWWADLDLIMAFAKANNMKFWILDDSHFPSGFANGAVIKHLELRKKYLSLSQFDFYGPKQDASVILAWTSPGNVRALEMKDPVIERPFKIWAVKKLSHTEVDFSTAFEITNNYDPEINLVTWDIPEGEWRVFVATKTIYGGERWTKDYVNPLDINSTNLLIKTVYIPHYEHYQAEFGKTFKGFFSDEARFGNSSGANAAIGRQEMVLSWDEKLEAQMSADELFKLFLLAPVSAQNNEWPIRYKYMNLVTKIYEQNYQKPLYDWCEAHNVAYVGHVIEDNHAHSHLGAGPGHFFRTQFPQHIAGIDVVLGQLMPGLNNDYFKSGTSDGWDGEFFHFSLAKLGSSVAHHDAKKKNRALCEIFGAFGWNEGSKQMKWLVDHMLVRGINNFVPHAFTTRSFPDPDCPPHFYANGMNPQFQYLSKLFKYMNKMGYLFENTKHQCDFAIMYDGNAEWLGDHMKMQKCARVLSEAQVDFDFIDYDLIKNAQIESASFQVNQEKYKTLVVPYCERIEHKVLEKLQVLVENGVEVIFVGEGLPVENEVLQKINYKKATFKNLSLELFKNHVKTLKREVWFENPSPWLRYFQSSSEDKKVHFIFNEAPATTVVTKMFVTTQKNLASYDFLNDEEKVLQVTKKPEGYEVEITLEPYESILIYEVDDQIEACKNQVKIQPLEVEAKIKVASYLNQCKDYKELGSYQLNTNLTPLLKEFSGKISYTFDVNISKNNAKKIYLDLDNVNEICELYINDELVDYKIVNPYRFEIANFIKEGTNKFEVIVINNLGRAMKDFFSQYSIVEPVGIQGQVKLITVK